MPPKKKQPSNLQPLTSFCKERELKQNDVLNDSYDLCAQYSGIYYIDAETYDEQLPDRARRIKNPNPPAKREHSNLRSSNRVGLLKANITRKKSQIGKLDTSIQNLKEDLAREDDFVEKASIKSKLDKAESELTTAKRDLEDWEKRLSQLTGLDISNAPAETTNDDEGG